MLFTFYYKRNIFFIMIGYIFYYDLFRHITHTLYERNLE